MNENEEKKALHDLITETEHLARLVRVISRGNLSLAVVNNHGVTLREREGMGWDDAHEAVERIFGPEATDLESLAREMFPAEYAAITDDHPMDPAKVRAVEAELLRRTGGDE